MRHTASPSSQTRLEDHQARVRTLIFLVLSSTLLKRRIRLSRVFLYLITYPKLSHPDHAWTNPHDEAESATDAVPTLAHFDATYHIEQSCGTIGKLKVRLKNL